MNNTNISLFFQKKITNYFYEFQTPKKYMSNYSQISSNCSQIYKFTNRRTEREQRRTDIREHISSSNNRKGTKSIGRRHTGAAAPAPGTPALGTPAGEAPPASAPGQRRQPGTAAKERQKERPWGGGRGAAKEPEQMPTCVRSNGPEFG